MTPPRSAWWRCPLGRPGTTITGLRAEFGITRQTLYRHISPTGQLYEGGRKILARGRSKFD